MKRLVVIVLILLALVVAMVGGLYLSNWYWIHRYDSLITKQAASHHLDPDLVWSIVYEETYFRPWQYGKDGEVGLMQVTPTVGRAWVAETDHRDLEREMSKDPPPPLRDPERNIEIACWYLEKIHEDYHASSAPEARMIAAYNAGPSRAADWNRTPAGQRPLSEDEFIARIDIPSTKAYVTSVLARYRTVKARHAGLSNSG